MKRKRERKPGKISRVLVSMLLVFVVVINCTVFSLKSTITQYMNATETVSGELETAAEALALEIQQEGTVLVQNLNDTLPLSEDVTQVNIFGWSATQWVVSGSGSGAITGEGQDLLTALEEYGISYNQSLIDMYTDFLAERPYYTSGTLNTYSTQFSRLYEPSISDTDYYTDELLAEALAYSDTAIVVIGRVNGESNDAPKTQYKQTTKDGDIIIDESRTYLDLSSEEEELLAYVGANYENVIVLINSTNEMALGAIETTSGVDACLIVGTTGEVGAEAIPQILWGEINPSGRVTDTYVYDLTTSSTYANSGEEGLGTYTNSDGLYPSDGSTTNENTGDSSLYDGVSYIDYVEGIYVGYKWYETADAEGYWDEISNEYGDGYDGVVQYPFGYGLSYTSFDWEIMDYSVDFTADGEISVTVKVTNTGSVAGKDVVQLYSNPPYYEGEIEKSSRNLVAFAKTEELEPGESQEITLTCDVYDLASYDAYDDNGNGFVGYELDSGEYEFLVSCDAHTQAASFTATLGEGLQFPEDPYSGSTVTNLFTGEDAVDGVSLDGGDSDANIVWLTRADFEGTFPSEKAPDRSMTDNIIELNLYSEEDAQEWDAQDAEVITTGAENGLSITNSDGSISALGYELGADYYDEQWEDLLDQLTISEMLNLTLHGYVHTEAMASVGKLSTRDLDGPAQIGSFNAMVTGTGFSNPVVLAQTFNQELSYQYGLTVGAEASALGVDGWYAPGVNLHRSAFGGRNYEYYSEDSYLSGVMAAKTVEGSLDAGTYVYAKHFVVYDQDSMRDGCYIWMTEQTLREIYLKPFQIMIQEGRCTGIMSAYNRIGAVWAGGSTALLTDLLREEWGFTGVVITDYSDHHQYMNGDQAIRAGGDLWMDGWLGSGTYLYDTDSNAFRQALRRAAKDVIYMYLNAEYEHLQYMEEGGSELYDPERVVQNGTNAVFIGLGMFDAAIIVLAAFYFYRRHRKMRT